MVFSKRRAIYDERAAHARFTVPVVNRTGESFLLADADQHSDRDMVGRDQ